MKFYKNYKGSTGKSIKAYGESFVEWKADIPFKYDEITVLYIYKGYRKYEGKAIEIQGEDAYVKSDPSFIIYITSIFFRLVTVKL